MNREQAEHILDAYTDMRMECGEVDKGYFKESCFCSMNDRYVEAEGFCKWGERRNGGQAEQREGKEK